MTQGEEGSHCNRPLTGSDEAAGHEVDGGDVVCVEGVAEAEDVGEGCGGDERGVKV